MNIRSPCLLLAAFTFAGCTSRDVIQPREVVDADEIKRAAVQYERVLNMEIEAWNSHDLDAIRSVYTEDIVHQDSDLRFDGIEEVMEMAANVSMFFPDLESRSTEWFIGLNELVAVFEFWNLELGGHDFSQDDPLIEVDLLEIRGKQISYWTLFYGLDTIEKQRGSDAGRLEQARGLLEAYHPAWSSGDPSSVAALYAKDAIRDDAIFGDRLVGREAIQSFAHSFFEWYPGAAWGLQLSFGEGSAGLPSPGGVFAIQVPNSSGKMCEVRAAVLLDVSNNEIVHEAIYYSPDSLLACGWAQ